ncbi:MAG: PAS domain-containing protein, partial [Oxalobacteraceae bacterium]
MNPSPLPLAVFVVGEDGVIITWNKACEKLAGLTPRDIQGQALDRILAFDEPADARLPTATGSDAELAGSLRCADGKVLPVRITIAPQCFVNGGPPAYSVILVPRTGVVSPRYALIQDLAIEEIIEGLPCVFYVIDPSGHLLLWNRQLETALERTSEEMTRTDVQYFFDEAEWPLIVQKILDTFADGPTMHEADLVGKHGKRTPYLFHCARTSLGHLPC